MIRLTFNKWALGGRRIWPVLRAGSWLFAVHRLWRWKPLTDRYEPSPFTEETRTGWSVVWLCVEVSHVR